LVLLNQDKSGQWKGATAGGCANNPATYRNNPTYQISLDGGPSNELLVELRGPKQYSVGFDVICVVANSKDAPGYFSKHSSGAFRSGYVVSHVSQVPSGTYNIIPSTFLPGQEGPFFLTVKASCPVKLARL
jgi:calpain-7